METRSPPPGRTLLPALLRSAQGTHLPARTADLKVVGSHAVVAAVGSTADRHPADGGYPKAKIVGSHRPSLINSVIPSEVEESVPIPFGLDGHRPPLQTEWNSS